MAAAEPVAELGAKFSSAGAAPRPWAEARAQLERAEIFWLSHCALTTGRNTLGEGLDVIVEGEAANVRDDAHLRRIADAYVTKYGHGCGFTVEGGAFHHHGVARSSTSWRPTG